VTRLIGSLTPTTRPRYDGIMSAIDPITVVESLNPDSLREQLAALDRQQSALRVLLRAALARRRDEARLHRSKPDGRRRPGKQEVTQ
jgi:hypothetical protein